MGTNWKMKIKMCDPSGLLLSLSGIVLGVLLAVAEYRVDFWAALVLIVTAGLIHAYMQTLNKWWMASSVASAVLTVYLSYGTLFSLESLILLLFTYFIIRLARGMGGRGRISDGVLTCLLNGPVALVGAYFVCTHTFPYWFFLFPSLSIGFLCVAADGTADNYGKVLTNLLIYIGIALMITYSALRIFVPVHFLFLITLPAFICITARMFMKNDLAPDTYRPTLALSTFALALLTGVGFIGYLF
jgi:hypothetical protein